MALTPGTGGAFASSNQGYPTTTKNATTTNFTSLVNFDSSPFLPETLDMQVKRFGNRSISGFLSKMAAEYALQSDRIQWTEQDRLHIRLDGLTRAANVLSVPSGQSNSVRIGQTLLLVQTTGNNAGTEHKALVTNVNGQDITVASYTNVTGATGAGDSGLPGLGTADITAIIYGSEFAKGTEGMAGSLDVTYVNRSNEPIILKDKYSVSGSDVAQIGWIEVQDVNGDGGHGYLWYLQSEMDQRARFMDYVETALVEAIPAETTTTTGFQNSPASGVAGISGSRGLFHEIESYGNVFAGTFDDGTAQDGLDDFDLILRQLDSQGNIEENMFYLNRNTALAWDNVLGQQSDFSGNGGGPSWGAFNNSKNMALNLGFDGVRRGGYSFYKTDWKYLNDVTGRRAFTGVGSATTSANAGINGIFVPAGSSSVYDEMLSSTIKRPMMHIRYRAAQGENRKLKNWVTGSVGGVYTSDADRMDVHYLSERCLVIQAANNFGMLKTK